jgi:hypothetical protein
MGKTLLHCENCGAVPVLGQKATARVSLEIVGGYPIPVFTPPKAELLTQPSHVKKTILPTIPVSAGNVPVEPNRLMPKNGPALRPYPGGHLGSASGFLAHRTASLRIPLVALDD